MKMKIVDGRLFVDIDAVIRVPIWLDLVSRRIPKGIELTIQEERCLRGVIDGKTNKQIATELHIAERTAKFHVSALLSKFNCKKRNEIRNFMRVSGRETWGL